VIQSSQFTNTLRLDARTIGRSLGLIRIAAPQQIPLTVALTLVEALLPAASIWLLKKIIDTVAAAARSHEAAMAAGRTALVLAGSYFLLACAQQAVRTLGRYVEAYLDDLLNGRMRLMVMEKASAYPDLTPFESPRFHDRLELLQREVSVRPMSLKDGLVQICQSSLTLGCMLFFLARYHPALALLLGVTSAPSLVYQRRLRGRAWRVMKEVVPIRRRLSAYADVLLTAPFAKEVRLYGFGDHFLARYRTAFDELIAQVRQARWRLVMTSLAFSLLAALGVGAAFAYVIQEALRGAITLGDLSLYTGALMQANSAAAGVIGAMAQIHDALPFMRELFEFLDSRPSLPLPAPERRVSAAALGRNGESRPERPREGFRLEGVTFRYPEAQRSVFQALDLEIPWGQSTALVGENGAGKSTLVKLLTRLYDPQEGRVLLNGIDLRDYDLEELRRQVGVVFQDFSHYSMPVWENIGLGDVARLEDRERIREAARRAGADGVIRRLPHGEETLLGVEFEGGVQLSGGEWQKIALARAFMRDAPILVLDEPTAALDARSEYEVYRRFTELAAGRTTLLISHRFSTVRMADRILVLEEGAVIEQGDHAALVARGGRYAELYAMQAERYRL
jgi:ATP-binding cassette subfamily B protein